MKSKILIDHFLHPRYMRELEKPSHQYVVRSKTYADILKLMALIDGNGVLRDIQAQVFGCGYTIAAASLFTGTAKLENVADVMRKVEEELKPFVRLAPRSHVSCLGLPQNAFLNIAGGYHGESSNGPS